MDRLLFQPDMIPSAHQSLKCGVQWDISFTHDQNLGGGGGGLTRDQLGRPPSEIVHGREWVILLLIRSAVQIIQRALPASLRLVLHDTSSIFKVPHQSGK